MWLFKDFEYTSSTYSCCGCDAIDLVKPEHLTHMTQNDPFSLNCALFEGQGYNHVMVEYLPPSIVKGEPYDVDKGYLSDL